MSGKLERPPKKPGQAVCGCSSVVEHHLAKVGVAGSNPVWRTIKLVPDENLLRVFSSNMYGGYSVAGLTRQFVALKTVSSNLTTHPTEYVLHYAERIFLFTYRRATFGCSFFLCTSDNDLYPTDLDYYIPPVNRQKKDGNLKAAAPIQRLYIL